MPTLLETQRLILRQWRDDDIEPWVEMSADERVMEFYPSIIGRAESERVAQRARDRLSCDGYGWWVAQVKGGADFIGVIVLQDVPFEAAFTPAFEIGWRLAAAYWGCGYATEGARAALAFAFDELRRDEVVAMTSTLNIRSQRVMQRLGMTCDPRDDFENPRVEIGHRLRPHVLYRVMRPLS